MRVEASLKNLRIAPRKVRLVTHSIVGLPIELALITLAKQVKRASSPIEVLLRSAMANATNNFKLEKESLFVKEVRVGDGVRLKRFTPKAFGQATQILRRSSQIKIILEGEEGKKIAPKKEKKGKETPAKKTESPEKE